MFLFENDTPWLKQATAATGETTRVVNVSRRSFLKTSGIATGATFMLGIFSGCEPMETSYADPKVPASGHDG